MTTAVLFDVDGTLIDSNDAHARAWVAALAEAGYDVPFERVRPLIGMGGDRVLPALVPKLRDDTEPGKSITARRLAIFKERELPNIRPTPGARELLEAVRARGARVVVATSAKKSELDDLLARGDLGPLVDVASTSDDAESSKPAPDIVEAALRKGGVAARDAVLIGDTKYDVEASQRAGVPCVALLCGGNPRETLAAADAIYADPAELIGALDRAPFAWSSAASTAP
ncbi:MAG TPA: HAD family hydrolase [Candidatus Elarobacter sp.]|nr:HAD family hydrolase [Candidatus Elarobacter sp.]